MIESRRQIEKLAIYTARLTPAAYLQRHKKYWRTLA
jgi:hypothetical protein